MDRQQAIEEAKNQLENYLQQRGIDTGGRRAFICLNPEHEDRHPSMSLDKARRRVKCFSCSATYDTLDLIGLELNTSDFNEQLNEACKLFNITLDTFTPTGKSTLARNIQPAAKTQPKDEPPDAQAIQTAKATIAEAQANIEQPQALAYLEKRGISLETAKLYSLGYLPDFNAHGQKWQGALIIPTDGGAYVARNTNQQEGQDKVHKPKDVPVALFNAKALIGGGVVYIAEGELDALAIIEAGGQAVGLGSTAYTSKLYNALERARSRQNANSQIALALTLDNDAAGLKTATEALEVIKSKEYIGVTCLQVNISGTYKDANEAWVKEPQAFKDAVANMTNRARVGELEAYTAKHSAQTSLIAFMDKLDEAQTPVIPTGYGNLDKLLDGGLYEGLYICGAISSLGKTTFALQMADQIAQNGQDVLVISLEMAKHELVAKSLSRETFKLAIRDNLNRRLASGTRWITSGKVFDNEEQSKLFMAATNHYYNYANRVFIREGMGDVTAENIRQYTQQHIHLTGNKPVIVVDYLQILQPHNDRATDKQNTDWAVLELKRISRDCKLPVVAISSLNRANYSTRISFEAFKESGAIEYSSDVLIGLQLQGAGSNDFDTEQGKKKNPRNLEAVILKNRNGATGSVYFDFYPQLNLFEPTTNH